MSTEKKKNMTSVETDMTYLSDRLPYELSDREFRALLRVLPEAKKWKWEIRKPGTVRQATMTKE